MTLGITGSIEKKLQIFRCGSTESYIAYMFVGTRLGDSLTRKKPGREYAYCLIDEAEAHLIVFVYGQSFKV